MLQVLLHLQKGGPEYLLSAYGEWFREVASSGHTSWQDYLLDEVSLTITRAHAALRDSPCTAHSKMQEQVYKVYTVCI